MSKKRRAWQDEWDVAALVLKGEPGALSWAEDDYVAFRYRDGVAVRIVFYPHKTSAGHHHLRIRDEHSKDKARFKQLADRLYISTGHTCTFQVKNGSVIVETDREPGWAAQEAIGHWI